MNDSFSPTNKIILYGHAVCPMLPPVWGMLQQSHVEFEYVDIHHDELGRARVREINHGYESVPTLVFPDGSTLTEPSGRILAHKLTRLGYHVPLTAWFSAYSFHLLMGVIIAYGLLSFLGIF